MNKYAKLAALLIALLVLSKVFPFARDVYLARTHGALPPSPETFQNWGLISIVFSGLVNFGCAIWLGLEARGRGIYRAIWSVFGLAFGFIGLITFYVLSNFTHDRA